ncbi:TetR/AcrR family transcriptional regulator [Lentilactobacillus diolivorans]|uniref:TetR/AcrR family transcriptional regulator n=1 Tax=Lentilactobacillus diolivorans TaxID=179838 RepID=UPI002468A156|nr:TetR/AcrR family transcriptional regulator [Lentilactobacillus diolivorans]MDH5105616.1 TetR/AcrR family transcriptional regulator [Lentilactobacillus diolivorans]
MKYDLSKKPTLGSQRMLQSFSEEMFELIKTKPFERITVREICTACNIPRATFYNYFDDKFDLLKYCWQVLATNIGVDDMPKIPNSKVFVQYFDDAYNFFSAHSSEVDSILLNNSLSSQLGDSFVNYFSGTIQTTVYKTLRGSIKKIPLQLLAEQYSNIIFVIFKWIFLEQNPTSKEQAHIYLRPFLNLDLDSPHHESF